MPIPLTEAEIRQALEALPDWTWESDVLKATYQFKDFKEAFAFMEKVAVVAEEIGHHPDWSNVYNKVSFSLNTHDAGGKITGLDVLLATKILALVKS